jgi:hypothetical protein
MKFYIPTYEECVDIVNNNPNMYFYERKSLVDGYHLSTFGYRYAKYNNFILPLIDDLNINALELKGITFVFDDNKQYKHFLLLHKFWELNQYKHCTYDIFKDKNIRNITVKEDGFLVSFLLLPNDKIISFTKHGFDEPTNIEANKFLDNSDYYDFINNCLHNNIQPIFEHVGRKTTVDYGNVNELILLKLRNNFNGEYLNVKNFDTKGIKVVAEEHKTFDEILIISKEIENCEGWVVQFEDDDMLKVKTKWWREKQRIK